MKIRLGYVALSLQLKNTSSSTLTYARYKKIVSEEKRLNELKRVTLTNIDALYEIIQYNRAKQIHFYRITSKLIPLATHPDVLWDFERYFSIDFKRVGEFIQQSKIRVDTHPDQFNVLNSIREDVVDKTRIDLMHHVHIFKMLGLDSQMSKMVLHVGSSQGGKEEARKRFISNFNETNKEIKKRIILENDDKIFTLDDVIFISRAIDVPIVFDFHHHICNPCENVEAKIQEVIKSWQKEVLPVKVHLSSPREGEKDIRKHADYINPQDFIKLVQLFQPYDRDFDVMLECKKKDVALFRLIEDIKKIKPEWDWIDATTLNF